MDIHVILGVAFMLLSTQADKCLEEQSCSDCSSSTQHCTTDCHPGYYGRKCNSLCSETCKNSTCILTQNGIHRCSDGCVPGFHGTRCDTACTTPKGGCTKCPQGCDGPFCHLMSSCVLGCHDSYYGSNCKNCSPRCRQCNKMTGTCIVCHDPYSGQDCQFSCENCSTTDCVQTCAPGLYGRTCSTGCSKNCLVDPITNTSTNISFNSCSSECERDSGVCISGCVHDWFGPSCTNRTLCSSHCTGCNETGACVEGCLSGFFGYDCKPCSENCFNQTCYPGNGSCDAGCIWGYHGHFCNQTCTDCPGGVCYAETGRCAEHPHNSDGTMIGVSTAFVLFVFGIIVSGCIFHCKRASENRDTITESHCRAAIRQQSEANRQGNSSRRHRASEHIYSEVNEDEMGPVIVFL